MTVKNEYLKVGVITSTHGLKGEVNIYPTTDDRERFRDLKNVYAGPEGNRQKLTVRSVSFTKKFAVLGFKEIDSIEQAEKLRNTELFVSREDAVPLEENEFFIADLIGMKVSTEEKEDLGVLTDVLSTGANDVYVVTAEDGSEVLIPAIPGCILDVNVEEDHMTVHLLPGLR